MALLPRNGFPQEGMWDSPGGLAKAWGTLRAFHAQQSHNLLPLAHFKNLLMGCFPRDFQEGQRPIKAAMVENCPSKRPMKRSLTTAKELSQEFRNRSFMGSEVFQLSSYTRSCGSSCNSCKTHRIGANPEKSDLVNLRGPD